MHGQSWILGPSRALLPETARGSGTPSHRPIWGREGPCLQPRCCLGLKAPLSPSQDPSHPPGTAHPAQADPGGQARGRGVPEGVVGRWRDLWGAPIVLGAPASPAQHYCHMKGKGVGGRPWCPVNMLISQRKPDSSPGHRYTSASAPPPRGPGPGIAVSGACQSDR